MTAAALNANDNDNDDCGQSCHLLIATDAISTIDPTFLKEWDAFYTNFLDFVKTGAATLHTNKNIIKQEPAGSVTATSTPPATDDPEPIPAFQELDDLHNKLTLLLLPSTGPPSINKQKDTPMNVANGNDNCDNNNHTMADCACIKTATDKGDNNAYNYDNQKVPTMKAPRPTGTTTTMVKLNENMTTMTKQNRRMPHTKTTSTKMMNAHCTSYSSHSRTNNTCHLL